ncbi:hypothetical protein O59_001688 [Cellvibrio sp. BR]|nr:hypothetical protein O59_001688 [Cellvibrio sp. BR]
MPRKKSSDLGHKKQPRREQLFKRGKQHFLGSVLNKKTTKK